VRPVQLRDELQLPETLAPVVTGAIASSQDPAG